MHLKYTDLKWAAFRVTAEYGRLLCTTDVTTRYVYSSVSREVLPATEYVYFLLSAPSYESLRPSDRVLLSYSVRFKSSATVSDFFAVNARSLFVERSVAVEVVRVSFRSPFHSSVLSSDNVLLNYTLCVSDFVGLNEFFFFGGLFRYNALNVAFATDTAAGNFLTGEPEAAVVSEFIRVGLRHMVDFYLGGFTLGGAAFGGRVR